MRMMPVFRDPRAVCIGIAVLCLAFLRPVECREASEAREATRGEIAETVGKSAALDPAHAASDSDFTFLVDPDSPPRSVFDNVTQGRSFDAAEWQARWDAWNRSCPDDETTRCRHGRFFFPQWWLAQAEPLVQATDPQFTLFHLLRISVRSGEIEQGRSFSGLIVAHAHEHPDSFFRVRALPLVWNLGDRDGYRSLLETIIQGLDDSPPFSVLRTCVEALKTTREFNDTEGYALVLRLALQAAEKAERFYAAVWYASLMETTWHLNDREGYRTVFQAALRALEDEECMYDLRREMTEKDWLLGDLEGYRAAFDLALETARKQLSPVSALEGFMRRAWRLGDQEGYRAAFDAALDAVAKDESFSRFPSNSLVQLAWELGDQEGYRAAFDAALDAVAKDESSSGFPSNSLVQLAWELGDREGYLTAFHTAIAAAGSNMSPLTSLVKLAWELGDRRMVQTLFQSAYQSAGIRQFPTDALLALAKTAWSLGDRQQFDQAFAAALESAEKHPMLRAMPLSQLAILTWEMGEQENYRLVFQSALREIQKGDYQIAFIFIGRTAWKAGDREGYRAAFQIALEGAGGESNPAHGYRHIAENAWNWGDREGYESAREKARASTPESDLPLFEAAFAEIETKPFATVAFGHVSPGSREFGTVEFGTVEFGSVPFGSVPFGSVEFGSVPFASAETGPPTFGSKLSGFSTRESVLWEEAKARNARQTDLFRKALESDDFSLLFDEDEEESMNEAFRYARRDIAASFFLENDRLDWARRIAQMQLDAYRQALDENIEPKWPSNSIVSILARTGSMEQARLLAQTPEEKLALQQGLCFYEARTGRLDEMLAVYFDIPNAASRPTKTVTETLLRNRDPERIERFLNRADGEEKRKAMVHFAIHLVPEAD